MPLRKNMDFKVWWYTPAIFMFCIGLSALSLLLTNLGYLEPSVGMALNLAFFGFSFHLMLQWREHQGKQMQDAQRLGEKAAFAGQPLEANPYHPRHEKWAYLLWEDSWRRANSMKN